MNRSDATAVWLTASWSFEQLVFAPRTLAMGLVAASPVLVALLYQFLLALEVDVSTSGFGVFSLLTATVGFQFVAPMLALFYASGVVSDDVEAGTMAYFLTRPRSRTLLMLGKMAGALMVQLLLFLPAIVVSYYLTVSAGGFQAVGARFGSLLQDVGAAILGTMAYNGFFALVGTAFKRPLLIGLGFVFGWQAAATYVPGVVRLMTIAHYIQSLLPHDGGRGLAALLSSRSSTVVAITGLVVIILVTHGAALWLFRRKELGILRPD